MKDTSLLQLPDDMIFSLDIGTRNVVGMIGRKTDEAYEILEHEVIEHPERAMFDGQIHDIEKVVKVVKKVVDKIESRIEYKLTKVAIAAAGRALKTQKMMSKKVLDSTNTITKTEMDMLEMECIQKAQEKLIFEDSVATNYYCVGYSVMHYFLDGSIIANPVNHKGGLLEVELIATFLPHIVVDSLYTVMDKAGLEVENLTLEPIAAINVTIPSDLRLLNLSLVDVGAGTSDIAITKDGTIVSYGMVAKAGDIITEALSREFLLDFKEAEKLKMSLSTNEEVSYKDILGIETKKSSEEVIEMVYPLVKEITKEIAKVILEVNKRPPSAVFCIGGGCQIPKFTDALSDTLSIPKERIVIKNTEMLTNVKFLTKPLSGPEYMTPVGIGYTAFEEKEKDFLQIVVNQKSIRLFNSRTLTVSDALVLVGYNARKLIPFRGEGISVNINGKLNRFFGEYGEAAKIFVNGSISSLDTKIKNKDVINVQPAVSGKKKKIKLYDIIGYPKTIEYNGEKKDLITNIRVNGATISDDRDLKNSDIIEYDEIKTLGELAMGIDKGNTSTFLVNNEKVNLNYKFSNGDVVVTLAEDIETDKQDIDDIQLNNKEEKASRKKVKKVEKLDIDYESELDNLENSEYSSDDYVAVYDDEDDEEPLFYREVKEEVVEDDEQPQNKSIIYDYHLIINGDNVSITGSDRPLVFVDIFDHINFDLSRPKGVITLMLNGRRAMFTDYIKTGDVIEIYWS